MTTLEDLLANNERFARTEAKDRVPRIPFLPHKQVYILTCIDPRVDPSDLFGLRLGDAIVARNVGGRVDRAVLDDLAWISYLHETKTPDADWFEFVIMHHTDCGSALMGDAELRRGFVRRGFDDATLRDRAVTDPATSVPVDVRRVREARGVDRRIRVSGFGYDVHTGLVSELVPPG